MAAHAQVRVEVGPWEENTNTILEGYRGPDFRLVSVESDNHDVIDDEFDVPDASDDVHLITTRTGEPGRARLRVVGRNGESNIAVQAKSFDVEAPAQVNLRFDCPEGIDEATFISDGTPVQFFAWAEDAAGEPLVGYLDRDIEVVSPEGQSLEITPQWRSISWAYSRVMPPTPGEYTVALPRFDRSQTFQVVEPAAVDAIDTRLETYSGTKLHAWPATEGRTVCTQDTAAYEVDAEALSDGCTVARERGAISVEPTSGSNASMCEVRLSYPRGNDGEGVERVVEVPLD